uniref:Nuclear transcription factor Y subunit gamma n=2 Tax=Schistocephalus solidus TaxID=70667 RepID=A0A0V0J1S4_SCHSO
MEYSSDIACESQAQVDAFWEIAKSEADQLKPDQNSFKAQDLPLARIKKIMKLDDDVRSMMISAEAPILFAKAAELFIRELTLRAWVHTERNRRRTLQRNDISMAVSYGDTDQFDFLIDIVPREEGRGHRRSHHNQSSIHHMSGASVVHQTADENAALKAEAMLLSGGGAANITLGTTSGENEGGVTVVPASVGSISLIQQQQPQAATAATVAAQPTIQFAAALPAGTATIQTLATTQGLTSATTSASSGAAQQAASATQIQYVFQLPVGTATGAAGQPFHIQMLPQQFQAASTDAVAATPGTIVAGPNGGLQVLQVVNAQTSGISLANSSAGQDAVGNRLQTVQVQLSDLTPGVSTSGC